MIKFIHRNILSACKGLLALSLLISLAPGVLSASGNDSISTAKVMFRFIGDRDMFYRVYMQNCESLDSLFVLLGDLDFNPASVHVYGYSSSKALSKIRSNRVKSEMIVRAGLTEDNFVTKNYAGTCNGIDNIVIVTIPLPKEKVPESLASLIEPVEKTESEKPEKPAESKSAKVYLSEEQTPDETDFAVAGTAENIVVSQPMTEVTPVNGGAFPNNILIRANLLRWATLTPDLGIEWRFCDNWSLIVESAYTSWRFDGKKKRYGLWEVAPEIRRYLGTQNRCYLGLMFKGGSFNYKLGSTGRQGDILGGGVTGGYVLPLGSAFSLDFTLGLGMIRARYDTYKVIDGIRVRSGGGNKNCVGPVSAGVTLIWKPFNNR